MESDASSEVVIPLSKGKIVLSLSGAVVFVAGSIWIWSIADSQPRYNPLYVKDVAIADERPYPRHHVPEVLLPNVLRVDPVAEVVKQSRPGKGLAMLIDANVSEEFFQHWARFINDVLWVDHTV